MPSVAPMPRDRKSRRVPTSSLVSSTEMDDQRRDATASPAALSTDSESSEGIEDDTQRLLASPRPRMASGGLVCDADAEEVSEFEEPEIVQDRGVVASTSKFHDGLEKDSRNQSRRASTRQEREERALRRLMRDVDDSEDDTHSRSMPQSFRGIVEHAAKAPEGRDDTANNAAGNPREDAPSSRRNSSFVTRVSTGIAGEFRAAAAAPATGSDVDEEEEESAGGWNALCLAGSGIAFWLPLCWVTAAVVEPGALGLVYLSLYVSVMLVPVSVKRSGTLFHPRTGVTSRVLVSVGLSPSKWPLAMSLLTSLLGLALLVTRAVWWCRVLQPVNNDGGGSEDASGGAASSAASGGTLSSSSSVATPQSGWSRAWPILGFGHQGIHQCPNDIEMNHAWVHCIIAPASLIALWAVVRLQRVANADGATKAYRQSVFPVEWSPSGVLLHLMRIAGYHWLTWLLVVVLCLCRPSVVLLPCMIGAVWFPVSRALQTITLTSSKQERDPHSSAVSGPARWLSRAQLLFFACAAYLYFTALTLIDVEGTASFEPRVFQYLTSIDAERSAAVAQVIITCALLLLCSLSFAIANVECLHRLQHGSSRGSQLPSADRGVWGKRSEPILSALHRCLFHGWYVTNAVLLFCLINEAPSVIGVLWLLLWVSCLWGGEGSQTNIIIVVGSLLHLFGAFVADLRVFQEGSTELQGRLAHSRGDVSVLIGVSPLNTDAVRLSLWLLSLCVYNLCVLSYLRSSSNSECSSGTDSRKGLVSQWRASVNRLAAHHERMFSGDASSAGGGEHASLTISGQDFGGSGYGAAGTGADTFRESYVVVRKHVVEREDAPRQPQRETRLLSPTSGEGLLDAKELQQRQRPTAAQANSDFVKRAVDTTEMFVIRLFLLFYELVRQYFYLFALLALFLAAVVRVNSLHIPFLVLFGVCLLRKEFSIFAWGVVVLYSIAVLVAQYAVVAFVDHRPANLVQAGFVSSDSWDLWPYFLLVITFLFHFRLYTIDSIAELSDNVRRYLELAERVTIGLIVWVNVMLFGFLACTSDATLFGILYLMLFFGSLITLLEATSVHTPTNRLVYYWYLVVALNAFCTTCVYCYQLFPQFSEETFGKLAVSIGLTIESIGMTDVSAIGLWPKIMSLLMCLVQARAWHARRGRVKKVVIVTAPPQQDENIRVDDLSHTQTVLSVIMAAANLIALLLSIYATPIAVVSLLFGSVYGASSSADGAWGGQSSLVQLVYFAFGCLATISTRCLRSSVLWRLVQLLSGCATFTAFLLQFPDTYPESVQQSQLPPFLLVGVNCATHVRQWFVVFPHILIFLTASLQASFIRKANALLLRSTATSRQNGEPAGLSSEHRPALFSPFAAAIRATIRLDSISEESLLGATTAAAYKMLEYILHPSQYMRFVSFHLTVLTFFVNGCVRRNTAFGLLFFLAFVSVTLIGKTEMGRGYRWFCLAALTFLVMVTQFVLHLRPPPTDGIAEVPYLSTWMVGHDKVSPEILAYIELQPSTAHVLLTVAAWCAMLLHYSALKTHEHFERFYGIRASAVLTNGRPVQKISVTERLKKHQAISLARRHGAMEFFKRLLPIPSGARDFTQGVTRWDRLRLVLYKRSSLLVLVAMFLHALYDGTTDLSVFKVLSLLLVLLFLQNLHRLPWRGNGWWRYIVAFHMMWLFLRLLLFVPHIVQRQWFVCACQVAGVMPQRGMSPGAFAAEVSVGNEESSCPGAPYNDVEFIVQATMLILAVAQYAIFEKSDMVFVLHHLHHESVIAARLGEAIREARRHTILQAKRKMRQATEDMLLDMRQISSDVAGGLLRPNDLAEAGGPDGHITPPLHTSFFTMPPSVSNDTQIGTATDATGNDQASQRVGAAITVRPTDEGNMGVVEDTDADDAVGDRNDAVGAEEEDSVQQQQRRLLEGTLDSRSLALLSNIDANSDVTPAQRSLMRRTMHGNPTGMPFGSPATAPSVTHGQSFTVADSEGVFDATLRPAGSSTSNRLLKRSTESSADVRSASRPQSVSRSSHTAPLPKHASATSHSIKKTVRAVILAVRDAFLATVDQAILWLDRHGVAARVVRLEQHHLEGRRMRHVCVCLYRWLFSSSHLLSYALYSLQFALAPCAINAVLPLTVFSYAAMMNPRPHRGYWRFCLVFLQIMILAKCLIRMGYCEPAETNEARIASVDTSDTIHDASWVYGRTCTSSFFLVDMMFDLLCVLVTMAHTAYLRAWGLWNDSELLDVHDAALEGIGSPQLGSSPSAVVPNSSTSRRFAGSHHGTALSASHAMLSTKGSASSSAATDALSFIDIMRSVWINVRSVETKLGTDVYRIGFACELLTVLIIFFGYYNLVGSEDTLVNSLINSLLPGVLAVLLLLLFLFIVVDRVVYVRRLVLGNVCLNIFYALFYHVVMIAWFIHQTTFVRTYLRDSSFSVRGSLGLAATIYLLKCCYLLCNARQVSMGHRLYFTHVAFSGTYSSFEYLTYTISRLTPFVFDMRVILDWAVTPSSLKLPYWMKQEDVAHELYSLMCDKEDSRVAQVEMNKGNKNAPYPRVFRVGIGWLLFALLAVVLMFPLFLYSSFSPVLQQNWITTCSATLSLEGSPPFWSSNGMNAQGSASVGADGVAFRLNSTVRELMARVRPTLSMNSVNSDVIQQWPLHTYSNSLWAVSPPTLVDMIRSLSPDNFNLQLGLVLTVNIVNAAGDASTRFNSISQTLLLSPEVRGNMTAMLLGKQNQTRLPNMYSPYLFNRQSGASSLTSFNGGGTTTSEGTIPNTVDCVLSLSGGGNVSAAGAYFSFQCRTVFMRSNVFPGSWVLTRDEARCLSNGVCPNYELLSMNESAFALSNPTIVVESSPVLGASFLQSIGLIAAYTTFVLAIGRVLRFATTGSAFRTALEDMEEPEQLLVLLEYVYLARSRQEFEVELNLYTAMINMIRTDEDRRVRTGVIPRSRTIVDQV